MLRFVFVVVLSIALGSVSNDARGDDWTQFRGPAASGISPERTATNWDAETNIRWKTSVPGSGWSAPIVTHGRIILTTAVAEPAGDADATEGEESPKKEKKKVPQRFEVHCYDVATGKILWRRVAAEGVPRIAKHDDNTYASETPVTDGQRIIAYFGMTGLYCYDLDGQLLWQKDLGAFEMQMGWGTSSSPAIADGLVFIQVDNEQQSFLAAFDVTTGEERWRVGREEKSNWCSPIIWKNKHRAELVAGGKTIRSYEPSTGKQLWELKVGDRSTSASPAGNNDMLIVGGKGIFAVPAGADGVLTATPPEGGSGTEPTASNDFPHHFTSDIDIPYRQNSTELISTRQVLWSKETGGPGMASPLIYKDFVYVLERRGGIISCYQARDGKLAYKERIPEASEFWASPWASDSKIYCTDGAGTTYVLAAGAEFKVIATNALEGRFWATSAVTEGSILLRSADTMYRISSPADATSQAARPTDTMDK